MTKWGLTEHGFRRKTFSECLADRIERAKEVYGVNVDTSETSFLGTFIRNTAWDEAMMWEVLEDIYLSAFVSYAEGTSLDNVGEYLTISRRPATKSKGIALFEGEDEIPIPKGFKIKTADGKVFETTVSEVIKDGKAEIPIQSIEAGKHTNIGPGEITDVVNPYRGIESVTNISATEGGQDIETDEEFRARYENSYSRGGGSTVEAIRASLLDMAEVVDADVLENTTMEVIDGMPPKSIQAVVFGAEDEDIAYTIFENKAGGIQAFGNTVVEVEDSEGRIHQIGFTRAEQVMIWVKVLIDRDEGYPGDDVVKRAIINYIGGQDSDGIAYKGNKMGEDVILSRVMSSVLCLGGVKDIKVQLSLDGTEWLDSNIKIEGSQIAQTEWDKVVIEYV